MSCLRLALLCSYCLLSTANSKFFLCSVHRFRGRWTVVQKSKYDKTATSSTCRYFNVLHSLFLKKKSMQIIGLLFEWKRTQRSHQGVYFFWGHFDIKIANNLKVMEEAWHFDFFGSAEAKLTQTPTKFKLFRTVATLLNKISV